MRNKTSRDRSHAFARVRTVPLRSPSGSDSDSEEAKTQLYSQRDFLRASALRLLQTQSAADRAQKSNWVIGSQTAQPRDSGSGV